jgi:hypothetical protein
MAETFKMDMAYRNSQEYKEWVKEIKKEAPYLPIGLIEYAIIAHKTNPNYYKQDKNHKKILAEPIKPPKNAGEVVIKDAIHIGDLTEDIIKQREEFFEKHYISEQAEFIPKSTQAIEEVEA